MSGAADGEFRDSSREGAPHRVLVTGASAGLGRALVLQLLREGRPVTGIDRDEPTDVAKSMDALYRHERCDLSDEAQVDALTARLIAVGSYDLAIMAAGVSATGRFEAVPAAAHARLLRVNAEAPLVLADALIEAGRLDGEATLVLVASLSVDVGYPGAASYAASKDALRAYGRSLRLARRNHPQVPRALVVMPGPLRTEHAARHAPQGASEAKRMTPEECASRILKAVRGKRRELRPGLAATLAGWFGRLLPGAAARSMRRVIFAKLDREVW